MVVDRESARIVQLTRKLNPSKAIWRSFIEEKSEARNQERHQSLLLVDDREARGTRIHTRLLGMFGVHTQAGPPSRASQSLFSFPRRENIYI